MQLPPYFSNSTSSAVPFAIFFQTYSQLEVAIIARVVSKTLLYHNNGLFICRAVFSLEESWLALTGDARQCNSKAFIAINYLLPILGVWPLRQLAEINIFPFWETNMLRHAPVAENRLGGLVRSWVGGRAPPMGPRGPSPPAPGRRASSSLRKSNLWGSACISCKGNIKQLTV